MYDRLNLSLVPDPFRQVPVAEEPLTTLGFLDLMTLALANCQGLAGESLRRRGPAGSQPDAVCTHGVPGMYGEPLCTLES